MAQHVAGDAEVVLLEDEAQRRASARRSRCAADRRRSGRCPAAAGGTAGCCAGVPRGAGTRTRRARRCSGRAGRWRSGRRCPRRRRGTRSGRRSTAESLPATPAKEWVIWCSGCSSRPISTGRSFQRCQRQVVAVRRRCKKRARCPMRSDTRSFAGKVALSPGAAGGMGRATALAFAAAGAKVAVVGHRRRRAARRPWRSSRTPAARPASSPPTSPTPRSVEELVSSNGRGVRRSALRRQRRRHRAGAGAPGRRRGGDVRPDHRRQPEVDLPVHEVRDASAARARATAERSSTSPRRTRSGRNPTSRRTPRASTACSA